MIDRRRFFTAAAALPLAAAGGCAQFTEFLGSLPQYAKDIENIATDLGLVEADIAAIKGIPADVMAAVKNDIQKIKDVAAQIGEAASGPKDVLHNLIGNFATALSGIASAVGVHGAAGALGKVGTILQMALAVLPSILAVTGIAMAGPDEQEVAAARAYLAAVAARA